MTTLDQALNAITILNRTADALNERIHPTLPGGGWTVEKALSINNGTVLYGQTVHNWGGTLIPQLQTLGCKRWHGVLAYGPGRADTFDIQAAYINASIPVGMVPCITLLDNTYGTSTTTTAKAKQLAQQWAGKCDQWIIGNEPWSGILSPQEYFSHLQAVYAAIKSGNPNALVLAPATTGNDFAWAKQFIALKPWSILDGWAWHTYYGSPEESFTWNLNMVPQMVEQAAGKPIPMYIEEVGWALEAVDQTGSGAVGFTEATRTKYAGRYVFLAAGTHNLRALTLYAAHDEGQPLWGAYSSGWASIYPYAQAVRDAFVHVHQATGAAVYTRGQKAITLNPWFVRLDNPAGQKLAIGQMSNTPVNHTIWVVSPSDQSMVAQTIGGPAVTIPLKKGQQQIQVSSEQRARVLSGAGLSFPEFT